VGYLRLGPDIQLEGVYQKRVGAIKRKEVGEDGLG
jgi:hypothetical protein